MEDGVGNSPETGGVMMEFPVSDGAELLSRPSVPPKLRRRLTESSASTSPASIGELESKLRNADIRRQKFYENVSSKARPKCRSPQAADDQSVAQRLEAKLQAAERKRMQILKAHSQRRATLRERISQSLLTTIAQQSKHKEHVNAAISKKHAEAEKKKANARVSQVRKVAKFVSQQQETERRKLTKSLEDKLQKRAGYHMQKVSLDYIVDVNWNKTTRKQAHHLSRILLRCWRKFLMQRTTLDLAKNYHVLNINANHGKSMPFEHFAFFIDKYSTLATTKALLDRLETRYKVLMSVGSGTSLQDISHLLTRVVKTRVKLSRYQPRIVLSAYMILGHPHAVFSGQGVRETNLSMFAKKFVEEFELLIDIVLNGPIETSDEESRSCTFRSQVAAFDAAWCSYLNSFVAWKVKDVESLEEDLVRAACQMEISMMHKPKPTPEGDYYTDSALSHDVKAVQKQMQQVTEHQKMLTESLLQLSGEAGIERLQIAVSDTRRKYVKSKEKNVALLDITDKN